MFAFDILVGERVEGDGGGQVADGRCGNAGEVQQDRDFRPEADIKRKRPRVLVRLIAEDIELVDILVWELRASDAIGGAIDFIEEGEDREFLGAGLVVPAVPAVQVVLRREEHAEGLHGAVAGGRLREVECVRAGVDDEARLCLRCVSVAIYHGNDDVLRTIAQRDGLAEPFGKACCEIGREVLAIDDDAQKLNVPIGINGDRDWRGAAPHERGC